MDFRRLKTLWSLRETAVFCALALLCLLGSLLRPDFFPTWVNGVSILQEMSQLGIVAIGMTFVINGGDIDLSVGSNLGLATAVFAVLTNFYHWNAWLVAVLVLILGSLIGLLNGFLVTKARMPAFIATLGMLFLARGFTLALSGGYNIAPLPPSSFYTLGQPNSSLGGLNNQVLIFLVVMILGSLVLWRTVFGYQIYAIGGNRQAATLAGINTDWVRMQAFTVCGCCASLAGLLNIAFLQNFSPTTGLAFELDVIAAVVVGGASIFGGRGSGIGAVLGAAILVIIRKILTVGIWLGGERPWRLLQTANPIFIGLAIVLAVLLDIWVREEHIFARLWARLHGRILPVRPTALAASVALGTGGRSVRHGVEGKRWTRWNRFLEQREIGGVILLVLLGTLGYSLRPDYFLQSTNIFNVLRDQIVEVGLIAVGMTFVIINKDIDLSVGSVLSLAAALWAVLVKTYGWNAWLSAGLALGVGGVAGFINGLLSTKGKLPAFIATLGMLHLARGVAASLAGGWQLTAFPPSSFFLIGRDNSALFGIPNQALILGVVLLLGGLALWRSPFGYQVYATGGEQRAAILAGVNVDKVRMRAFVLCSLLAALAGLISVAKLRSYAPQLGLGLELTVISGVIIGGTSIFGGRGSILGSLLGIFILGYLNSIITTGVLVGGQIQSIPQRWLQIIIGVVILGAILFDIWVRDERILQRLWSRRWRLEDLKTTESDQQ
jgi:ribose transport system permease protein